MVYYSSKTVDYTLFRLAHVKIASRIVLQNFVKNSGKKSTLPGTRDTAGQFRDCPGESGMVGNPSGRAFAVAGPSTWNLLPKRLRDPSDRALLLLAVFSKHSSLQSTNVCSQCVCVSWLLIAVTQH